MANVSSHSTISLEKEVSIQREDRKLDYEDEDIISSLSEKTKHGKGSLLRAMNVFDATAFFIGIVIGSGIFITPSAIQRQTGSFGVSMLCWLVGMVIAIVGGFCYIELGLLIGKTGGDYAIIKQAYSFRNRNKWLQTFGSLLAFLFTWTAMLVSGPCATAIIILTCCRYLTRPFYLDCDHIPESVLKTLSFFILGKITIDMQLMLQLVLESFFRAFSIFLNLSFCFMSFCAVLQAGILVRSVKLMAHVNNVTSFIKILSIIFIVLVGVAGVIKRGM